MSAPASTGEAVGSGKAAQRRQRLRAAEMQKEGMPPKTAAVTRAAALSGTLLMVVVEREILRAGGLPPQPEAVGKAERRVVGCWKCICKPAVRSSAERLLGSVREFLKQ